jgi:ABC-2 type transport system permease protein
MSRLFLLDYLATLRERKTWIVAGFFLYAVLAIPLLLARPPQHVSEAMAIWFGAKDPFVLFMYLWTDLAMNKMIGMVPVVLAGGVLLRERDTGVLAVLASKPLSVSRYFVLRAISACAVMATVYVGAHLVGAPYFAAQIQGFRLGAFFAAMSLQVWAAIFATALTATLAVTVGRRGLGALVALLILSLLVGFALMGFYNPAWRVLSLLNPLTLGVQALGHLDALGPDHILPPMLALMAMTALTLALGALAARRVEV